MFILKNVLRFVALAVIFTACTKEPDSLGTGVQSPSDRLQFGIDTTILLDAYSVIEDSIRTDETSLNILGSYWDPVFGVTTASIYTQFRLAFTGHDFGTNPQVDSLVLTLAYRGHYGDSTSPQTITIYELNKAIVYDCVYYSTRNLAYFSNPIATKTFIPRPSDSVLFDTTKVAPHLRIRLDQSAPQFVQKLMVKDSMGSNASFANYFKGLYITASKALAPGQGTLMYFNLESALSEMTLYYKNDEEDSLTFGYVINSSCARFNNFNHYNYQDADPMFRQQVINKDTIAGKNLLYLQAMGGVKTYLRFPDLTKIGGGKVAINEARLYLTNTNKGGTYAAPEKLILVEKHPEKEIKFLTDQFQGDDYFGGHYNPSNGQYWFRITRYIQDLNANKNDRTGRLALWPSSASVRSNRVVLGGYNPDNPVFSGKGLKLQVFYTKIP